MMRLSKFFTISALASLSSARFVAYVDQAHNSTLPAKEMTGEITHVVLAFVQSYMLYNTSTLFKWWDLPAIKSHFNEKTTFMISIGGDPDFKAGFGRATKSPESQKDYAKKVADFVKKEGFDGVDIDWKQPGGLTGNETSEIAGFLPLLREIKQAIGDNMTFSIAAPGVEKYMYAYTKDTVPGIFETIDFANILTEDQMDAHSTSANYLSGISSCNKTIAAYLDRGMPAAKGNLGLPFYGQGYSVQPECQGGLGCTVIKAGETVGNVTGRTSSVMWTPEFMSSSSSSKNFSVAQSGGACGSNANMVCPSSTCCSASGFCGMTDDHCGWNCLPGWGHCNGTTAIDSFKKAINDTGSVNDEGAYYLDKESNTFWTWDPESLYPKKYDQVVKANGLGGIMVYALGEDSYEWSHLKKLSDLSKGQNGNP